MKATLPQGMAARGSVDHSQRPVQNGVLGILDTLTDRNDWPGAEFLRPNNDDSAESNSYYDRNRNDYGHHIGDLCGLSRNLC
jgi:hypothetical protein